MVKVYKTNMETGELNQVDKIEKGTWVNIVRPTKEEIDILHEKVGISDVFSKYLLDYEERARIDTEDDQTLIVMDVPLIDEKDKYITAPLSIIVVRDDIIITSSSVELNLIDMFTNNKVKSFYTYKRTSFILQLLFLNASQYLKELNAIIKQINILEEKLQNELDNKEILKMLSISNSLVYFSSSLKSNEIVMEKLLKGKIINLYDEDIDILEDTIVENKQAMEMTVIYSDILNSATETYSSLVSNNLNNVMKFLAGITIVLSLPTMVASLFGMNVILPFSGTNPNAFAYILLISLIISIFTLILLKLKKML